ncbi:recombinase family protein [Streptomyces sp. NBC_01803]|uniref:recombinase family protein n=1 Tax=Streptomyces sp. NBC_01803 TaxID=2975946 RepID=UPI002DD92076|nr:recombinase family protein [Streptomyces sp. NBC_01803]WSA44546.1 recombinase family protein [Streptomyces sp. NBC_01803]
MREIQNEEAAIYCRISKADDEDQTGVDRQEELCREVAQRLGLRVVDVFKDNNRSAWQRNRKRPRWEKLLADMAEGKYRHVIVYHPDRLMRQPRDLEELLSVADNQHITLHGQANRRDLSDPDDRFILRIEVAHACRSSDDTSRRVKDAYAERRREGKPHTGRRQYGYTPDGMTIMEHEAEIIRDIFRLYLDGKTATAISRILHERGEVTAEGKDWQPSTVRNMLDSRRLAGIISKPGEPIRMGTWPPVVDIGVWQEAQERRAHRGRQEKQRCTRKYFYTLRGIVTCTCGSRMGGSSSTRDTHIYRCARSHRNGTQRCPVTVSAEALERLMRDLAIRVLEGLDVSGRPMSVTPVSRLDADADAADQQQLTELDEMWTAKEISTPEYRAMRRTISDRIKARQRVTITRPVVVLDGITGPNARAAWQALEDAGDHERINAIFQHLYAAVIIKPRTRMGRGLDLRRIEVEPNNLHLAA